MTRSIQQLRTVGAGGSYSERGISAEARWLGAIAPQPGYAIDEVHFGTARTVQPGRAALFDGVDDRVLVPHNAAFDIANGAEFTVSCWMRTPNAATFRAVVTKRNSTSGGWELAINTTGVLRFVARGSSTIDAIGIGNVHDNAWHHCVATVKPTEVRLYRDGVLDRLQTGTHTSTPASTEGLYFGARVNAAPGLAQDFFGGHLFDVRIYNRALTAAEVAAIHSSSRPGGRPQLYLYPANLVGHWKLDEGDNHNFTHNEVMMDSSGNGRHGQAVAVSVTFDYIGDDVPFSWKNEVGFSSVSESRVPASWTSLYDDDYTGWAYLGGDANGFALSGQTWRGSSGVFAARWLNGTPLGFSKRIQTNSIIAIPANTVAVMTAEIALSRPLVVGEIFRIGNAGGANGGYLDISSSNAKSDVTQWNQYVARAHVHGSATNYNLYTNPNGNVTGGDITIYFRNARVWNTGIASTDAGYLDLAQWPDKTPAKSVAVGFDAFDKPLQYSGQVPRNAKLKDSLCGNFDGTDDFVSGSLAAAVSYPFTLAGWFNLDSFASSPSLVTVLDISAGDKYISLGFSAAANFNVQRRNTTLQQTSIPVGVTVGRWFHVAVRFLSDTAFDIYVDGLLAASLTGQPSVTLNATFNDFTIGVLRVVVPSQFMDGRASDVRLYSSSLSASDILLLASGLEPSTLPTAHWPLAEGDGTTAFDITPNVSHGTLSNITLGTFWSATEQIVHRNLRYGYRLSGSTRIPARQGGLLAADGNAITHPAIIGHNGAETKIDFTGGQPEAPWCDPARLGLTLPQSYAFGNALPSGMTKRVNAAQNNAESLYTVT